MKCRAGHMLIVWWLLQEGKRRGRQAGRQVTIETDRCTKLFKQKERHSSRYVCNVGTYVFINTYIQTDIHMDT
jgi:hypothetical protein